MTESIRFSLPFILTSQSQKEVTHNEALTQLDLLLHLHVESDALSAPPVTPAEGMAWIVASASTGLWAGQEAKVAQWLDGQWRFIPPQKGMRAWIGDQQVEALYDGAAWRIGEMRGNSVMVSGQQVVGQRGDAIPDPAGGQTIDTEARDTLSAILAIMRQHGLIAA